ncbi:putative porin [Zhouia sp. PK063]|uniref:putative porin n=1 Tax=Zhouia sp. PK063 TaxID=3373602 RepID=UPI00378C9EDD
MKKSFLFLLTICFSVFSLAQQKNGSVVKDTTLVGKKIKPENLNKKQDKDSVSIYDYKVISYQRDTTYLDTSLTIQKEYKYNYLRKDNFELLRFSNIGQSYNRLGYDFDHLKMYPELGARSKHYSYLEAEDINYYNVPTPTTDVLFKTVMSQGQLLDAFLTFNTNRRLNFSIAYKGLRSLGKYQHALVSNGNFRFTSNYITKNGKYEYRLHFTSQDLLNEENGGISNLNEFTSGDPEFSERSRLNVRFEDAENFLLGKRYFFDHKYNLIQPKDSSSHYLSFGHQFIYETKYYQFKQDAANDYFGETFANSNLFDRSRLKTMYNKLFVDYGNSLIGDLSFFASNYHYNNYYNGAVITDDQVIQNQLKGNEIAIGGSWSKKVGAFDVEANIGANVVGNLGGLNFQGSAAYQLNKDAKVKASVYSSIKMPNFNFLLYQSDYKYYNWQHTDDFSKEKIQTLNINLDAPKWISLDFSYSLLNDYTYFSDHSTSTSELLVSPEQMGGAIHYVKATAQREFKFGKFALDNKIMLQEVSQSESVLNVPKLVTRNTFYYTNFVFKKAMYLQTGLTLKYFSKYNADGYNPLLGEFFTQNKTQIGNFPMLDFFINARVRETRIYLKAEHINSLFSNNNYFSAPNYPYRDFIVRFGVVWNFFS